MFLPFIRFDTPNTHISSNIVVFALCLVRLTSSGLGRMNKRQKCILFACLWSNIPGRLSIKALKQFCLRIFNTFLSGIKDAIS